MTAFLPSPAFLATAFAAAAIGLTAFAQDQKAEYPPCTDPNFFRSSLERDRIRDVLSALHTDVQKSGKPLTNEARQRATNILNDFNQDLLNQRIPSTTLLISEYMCMLTIQTHVSGRGADIVLKDEVGNDPQCKPKNEYLEGLQRTGHAEFGFVSKHKDVQEKYHSLRKLIECQNHIAATLGETQRLLPEFELKLDPSDSEYRFVVKTNGAPLPQRSCRSDSYSLIPVSLLAPKGLEFSDRNVEDGERIKISQGLACLLRKAGFWDGHQPAFIPPVPGDNTPSLSSLKDPPTALKTLKDGAGQALEVVR